MVFLSRGSLFPDVVWLVVTLVGIALFFLVIHLFRAWAGGILWG